MPNDSNPVRHVQVGATAGSPGSSWETHLRLPAVIRPPAREPVGAASRDGGRGRELRRRALEDELSSTRAALRATHEELQTSRDALRASELERRRLTDELHGLEEELRVGITRREQFLAMLSHELRNPLAAVLHATAILRLEATAELAARGGTSTRACHVVERQTRHLARLLDALLDVARITSGKLELRERACDLRDAIRGGMEAIAPMLAERSLQLACELPEAPVPLRGDPARLQQVVEGILSNAARHSNPGGRIELLVRREPGAEHVRVALRDHGSGIDPELLPHVFEPFVQSEQALDRPHGGLGLGLTLVRHIVELHGGSVGIESEGSGRGCELTVRLPLAPPVLAIEDPTPARARPCRIVLVEDQPDAREMMRLLLTTRGHQVVEAEDGGAGVDAIERVRPDAALVDIGLPTMSGYDVARRIRGNRSLDSVTLVAITGYGTHADVEAAHDAGFDEHLTKPADTRRLESILARCSPLPG